MAPKISSHGRHTNSTNLLASSTLPSLLLLPLFKLIGQATKVKDSYMVDESESCNRGSLKRQIASPGNCQGATTWVRRCIALKMNESAKYNIIQAHWSQFTVQ